MLSTPRPQANTPLKKMWNYVNWYKMMQIETWWNTKLSLSKDHKMFPNVNENISQTTRDQKIIAIEEIQTFVLNFNFFHSDRFWAWLNTCSIADFHSCHPFLPTAMTAY